MQHGKDHFPAVRWIELSARIAHRQIAAIGVRVARVGLVARKYIGE